MADFQAALIEKAGSHYHLTQGGDLLLRVPCGVFERFEQGSVFPPLWDSPGGVHPVRRLYWNPGSLEFLMFGVDEETVRFGETFGPSGYRSFVQGFWVPKPPLVLLRPFWNPANPYEPFDNAARRRSARGQKDFLRLLERLRPPRETGAILNAVAPYLDALGVNLEGKPGSPDEILEVTLTPAAPLNLPAAEAALETLLVEQAGDCFPVLKDGALVGVHTMGRRELHAAEAVLAGEGLDCREGPAFPH